MEVIRKLHAKYFLLTVHVAGKVVVTWARIVALYAFGARLAMYCQEKEMKDFCKTIAGFLGTYAAEVVTPFVIKSGGWVSFTLFFLSVCPFKLHHSVYQFTSKVLQHTTILNCTLLLISL